MKQTPTLGQHTMKISSTTKQKPTKVVNARRRHDSRFNNHGGSPSKHDALITPVLSQVKDHNNSSMIGLHKASPRRPITSANSGIRGEQRGDADKDKSSVDNHLLEGEIMYSPRELEYSDSKDNIDHMT